MNTFEKVHQREKGTQPEEQLAINSMKKFIGQQTTMHAEKYNRAREQVIEKTSFTLDDDMAFDLLLDKILDNEGLTYRNARGIVPEADPPSEIPGLSKLEDEIAQTHLIILKQIIGHYLANQEEYNLSNDFVQDLHNEQDRIKKIESTGIMELEPGDKRIKNATDNYASFKTVEEQFGGSFFHVFGPGSALGMSIDRIDCRLYMCPKAEKVGDLCKAIMNAHLDRNPLGLYYYKFATRGNRNDRIVYYTNYDKISEDLEIFNEIASKQPELFEGMGKNPFWGNIEGAPKGVYFGEEVQGPLSDKESYGSLRARIFDQTFKEWFDKELDHQPMSKTGYLQSFYKAFGENLYKNGINPDNLSVNLTGNEQTK